jgi:ATP-dependent RNA helicase DeaD
MTKNGTQNEKPAETGGFSSLGLSAKTVDSLTSAGYIDPSPIQASFIPIAVTGRDCIGQARTGTGKTAAFILPIIESIDSSSLTPQAIILTPTRELSEQVSTEFKKIDTQNRFESVVLVGGRPIRRQISDLKRCAHIVVGTPGRVIDLIQRRVLDLSDIKIAVLDEADRMLDIGFRPDIEKILRKCPKKRQTLLLSATMPPPVEKLAKSYMVSPESVDMSEDEITSNSQIEQFYATVDQDRKKDFLARLLYKERPQQALVFTRTKRGAEQLYKNFSKRLPQVAVLHGDLQQRKRDRVMEQFRSGKVRLLIATDIVGRGIDVSGVSHIINYDVPEFHDDYVHRIGRTGRLSSSGGDGWAILFVTKDQGEQLTKIEKRINQMLPEYNMNGFQAFKSAGKRGHVDDYKVNVPDDEEESDCDFDLNLV